MEVINFDENTLINQSFKRNYWKCTEDYEVHFTNGKNVFTVNDKFEIDVSQKKITFQKY